MSIKKSLTFINDNCEKEQKKTHYWINQISPSISFELHYKGKSKITLEKKGYFQPELNLGP